MCDGFSTVEKIPSPKSQLRSMKFVDLLVAFNTNGGQVEKESFKRKSAFAANTFICCATESRQPTLSFTTKLTV